MMGLKFQLNIKHMKKQDFLSAVEHEVRSLKEHATESELKNLNFDTLNYDDMEQCIYGQMTGDCSSVRAKELMDKSCIIVTNDKFVGANTIGGETYAELKTFINGKNEGQGWNDDGGRKGTILFAGSRNFRHLSALEAYICLKEAKKKNIVNFLRGDVDTLKL